LNNGFSDSGGLKPVESVGRQKIPTGKNGFGKVFDRTAPTIVYKTLQKTGKKMEKIISCCWRCWNGMGRI